MFNEKAYKQWGVREYHLYGDWEVVNESKSTE